MDRQRIAQLTVSFVVLGGSEASRSKAQLAQMRSLRFACLSPQIDVANLRNATRNWSCSACVPMLTRRNLSSIGYRLISRTSTPSEYRAVKASAGAASTLNATKFACEG